MRRPRSFWEARIAELVRGRSIESIAQRHGVTSARLRWWRWRLGTATATAPAPTRMVEIVPARTMPADASLRVYVVGVVLELPADTPPEYVGRVLCAARAAC